MEDGNQRLTPDRLEASEPSLEKKRMAMLERLADRHQSRLESRPAESDPSFESTSSFLSRFEDSKRAVESRIALCRESAQPKLELDAVAGAISDLEKLVAEKSYFLPSYEVRSLLKAISDLRQSLEILSSELIPKKKFSFKNKSQKKEKDPVHNDERRTDTVAPSKAEFKAPESPGIRNKAGEILVRKFEGSEIGEFTISDLDSCEVRLIGNARALFIHRLRNCKVYCGPVTASILIEGVDNCVFVMASHQIRIHHAKHTDFYLRVRSRPIIEDTNNIRVAPYCLRYDGLDRDLENAGLDEETGNWANVDDFLWLRAVQSPNWSVLPENERIAAVTIPVSCGGSEEI